MRKILFLFALLLILPLLSFAEDTSSLGVDVLSPVSCEATTAGSPIALYCGPTQGFYRADEETLDPGKPYVYFGHFDCWSMVAQGTPDAFGPVGWVESALLDTLPDMPARAFESALTARVEEDAPVTNDPLAVSADNHRARTLPRGTQVVILAQMGDWLYIQTELDTLPARVFIPSNTVL